MRTKKSVLQSINLCVFQKKGESQSWQPAPNREVKRENKKKTTSSAECNNHASEEAENSNENLTGARMELADRYPHQGGHCGNNAHALPKRQPYKIGVKRARPTARSTWAAITSSGGNKFEAVTC